MRRALISFMSFVLLVALTQAVHAQGNSKALGKALRKSGSGLKSKSLGRASKNIAKTRGLSQSAKSLSRSSKSLSRASQSLSRTGRQLGRTDRLPNANTAATRTVGLPHALGRQRHNAQRQLDHHLAEAQRLRQLATDTGNPELVSRADLIEAQAQQRFDSQTVRINEFQARHNLTPVTNPTTPVAGTDAPLIDSEPVHPAPTVPVTSPVAPAPAERTAQRELTFSERVRALVPFLK